MKQHLKLVLTALAMALQDVCIGGVPVEWTRRPDSTTPANFTAHHGETLELRCTFRGFGELPFGDGGDVRLYFQTNGMGEAWWSSPAAVSSNEVSAAWGPEMDSGADRWVFFFGRPGVVYASAIVRLVKSPGFAPGTLPPPTMFEDMVAAIVTNEVAEGWTEWKFHCDNAEIQAALDANPPTIAIDYLPELGLYYYSFMNLPTVEGWDIDASYGMNSLSTPDESSYSSGRFLYNKNYTEGASVTATRQRITKNALGLARLKDLDGKADAAITNDIEDLKTESSLIYRLFNGSNIVMEVTNYNSRTKPQEMRFMRLNADGNYDIVWTETNGLERTYQRAVSNTTAQLAEMDEKFAPKAWSRTTSGLGADAPEGTTWISTPQTVIAGGLEFQKTLTTSGQLWFLRSNGMMATMGAAASGFFEITATDGTPLFSIEKTDSYLAPVDSDGISVEGDTVTVRLSVVAEEHPLLRYAPSLEAPVAWQKEEDGFSSPIAVAWSGGSGAWECSVTTSAASGFFTFEYLQEGVTKIKSGGVMDVSTGGIMCTDGIHKCRPVWNGGTITWEAF